jgi:osmoprotectant transport system permease protein
VLGFASSALVIVIAIPIGIAVTRKRFAAAQRIFGGHAGSCPSVARLWTDCVVLFVVWGRVLARSSLRLATFSLLPVLRNTIVGLEQVDHAVIEAGRGMGYTKRQVLFEIELPLAVPVIIAGIRTAIVINIGMAALAFLIGGGGLGETINSGLKLDRNPSHFDWRGARGDSRASF